MPEPVPVPVPDPTNLGGSVNPFDHERLDVYQTAIEFVALADEVVERLPRGRAYPADQLQRAATSVPLNIAEGAGEFASKEKGRFYRMAKRSATEGAAVLDVCHRLKLIEQERYGAGRELLLRIVAMLTQMARRMGASGTMTSSEPSEAPRVAQPRAGRSARTRSCTTERWNLFESRSQRRRLAL